MLHIGYSTGINYSILFFWLIKISNLQLPLQNEGTYNFSSCCSFCFGSTELAHVVVRIPAAGYIPGDTISIEIVVDNKSNAVITCIAQLRKVRDGFFL